jgi:hypothetical protein
MVEAALKIFCIAQVSLEIAFFQQILKDINLLLPVHWKKLLTELRKPQ